MLNNSSTRGVASCTYWTQPTLEPSLQQASNLKRQKIMVHELFQYNKHYSCIFYLRLQDDCGLATASKWSTQYTLQRNTTPAAQLSCVTQSFAASVNLIRLQARSLWAHNSPSMFKSKGWQIVYFILNKLLHLLKAWIKICYLQRGV